MNPAPRDGVEDIHVEDANGFLDVLSPRNSRWLRSPGDWVYRGQTDADWKLEPSAHRADAFSALGGAPGDLNSFQLVDEVDKMLNVFQTRLERSAMPVPVNGPAVHGAPFGRLGYNTEPAPERFALMALAQHYGLPTMLLDWTRRAYFAAYFAGVGAADPKQRKSASHLAVWALRAPVEEEVHGVRLYNAPGSTNPNLHAQAGLFTILSAKEHPLSVDAYYGVHERDLSRPEDAP